MRFYVIYEFECSMDQSVRPYTYRTRSMQLTERYDGEPSEWCSDLWKGKCKHRKYAGTLSREQFDELIRITGLSADSVETMGSLTECGWLPAISFRNDTPEAIQSAYVTPIPELPEPDSERKAERAWTRVRRAMLRVYGG